MMHNNHVVPGQQGNFIGIALSDSLKPGHKYDAEFYLSLCDSARFASRNVGLHVSMDQPNSDIDSLLSIVPEVRYDGPFLSDKEGWMRVSGSFFAQGGEDYLTIGNFDGAEKSDTLNLHEGGSYPNEGYWEVAAYFLDDVSLAEDTSYHVGIESDGSTQETQESKLKVYPNPVNSRLSIEINEKPGGVINLVDAGGRTVLSGTMTQSRVMVDVSGLTNGVYTAVLRTEYEVLRTRIVVQH